ncbi:MAG TPA: Xaa-Pro peptidase family protein [bacterium]|nr:Xaa-Pro peptidase family protein [bacterium]
MIRAQFSSAPSTPRDELRRRSAALQRHLRASGLDAAVITQNVNLFYFGGSIQSGALIVPVQGEPVYAVRRIIERARAESALDAIVPLPSLRGLAGRVAEALGRPAARVGMELDVLPVAVRDRFAAALGAIEIIDVSAAVRRIRSIKSPYELEKLRATARLSDAILGAATEALREGITELELSALIEAAARRRGHEGVIRLHGWNQETYYGMIAAGPAAAVPGFPDLPLGGEGPGPSVPYGAGWRRIARGDAVIVDAPAVLGGYIIDQTRTLVIGRLPDTLARAHDAAMDVLKTVEAAIRPGVAPEALYRLSLERAEALGYADAFMGAGAYRARYVGHGVGLELDEWPVLADGFTDPLEPGCVFAVEPKMLFPGLGVAGIEDQYAVTAAGCERLTLAEQRLFAI